MTPDIYINNGTYFNFLTPETASYTIYDIANALSKLCRFTGQPDNFYCPTLDQRILTSNLEWKFAGDLKLGDSLVGFDEYPTNDGNKINRRKLRPTNITFLTNVKRNILRLEFSDGSTVKCSEEHPWLISTKTSNNQIWKTSIDIKNDIALGRKRYINRYIDTWGYNPNRNAGWLAGLYDGEGHLSFTNRRGTILAVSQNKGLVFDEIEKVLKEYNIDYSVQRTGNQNTFSFVNKGGWPKILQFLGEFRSIRLLNKFHASFLDGNFEKYLTSMSGPLEIVKVYDEGEEWVAGIETNTHTYFCEGFGAHNSVAEHSVNVSYLVEEKLEMEALLHDGSEAFINDISTPLKQLLPQYKVIEERIERDVCRRFNLPYPLTPAVKYADKQAYGVEKLQVMHNYEYTEYLNGIKIPDLKIKFLTHTEAKTAFLERYFEILGKKDVV